MTESASTSPPPDRHAAARALFENTPNIKFGEIARQVGCAVDDVRRWRKDDAEAGQPWQVAHEWDNSVMSDRAKELAERYRNQSVDLNQLAESESEAKAVATFSTTVGAEVRSQLLEKHQQEWIGPRALIYNAMKLAKQGKVSEGFELAKVAKISAETLTLVQQGELKAFGIKPGEPDDAPLVVIERSGGDA